MKRQNELNKIFDWIFYPLIYFVGIPSLIGWALFHIVEYSTGWFTPWWVCTTISLVIVSQLFKVLRKYVYRELDDNEIWLTISPFAKRNSSGRTKYKQYGPGGGVWGNPFNQEGQKLNLKNKQRVSIDFTVSTTDEDVTVNGYVFWVPDPENIEMFLLQGENIGTAIDNMNAKFLTRAQRLIEDECAKCCSDDIVGNTKALEDKLKEDWVETDGDDRKKYGVDVTALNIGNVDYSDEIKTIRNDAKSLEIFGNAVHDMANRVNTGIPDDKKVGVKELMDDALVVTGKAEKKIITVDVPKGTSGGNGQQPIVVVNSGG